MRTHAWNRIVLAVFLSFLLLPASALANDWKPYDSAAFQKALASGETVFVSIRSEW
jgi:hypothetical protein